MKKCAAEAMGTFALVFVGTGAIIVNELSGGALTHVGVSLAFGLVVMAMIFAVGEVSGAHLNPAVTIGFWAARRFPAARVAPYLACQVTGAIAASALLRWLVGDRAAMGATVPSIALPQAFVLEVLLTFLLMFVILNVATGSREVGALAGIAVGATVAMLAMFAGPLTGASMNPARSLGPALIGGHHHGLWLFLLAPPAGALLGVAGCRLVKPEACCAGPCGGETS